MEKGRMCLSRASQVSVQDTTIYGMHISPLQRSQPLWPWSWAVLQHQPTWKRAGMGFSLSGWVWGHQCSNTESVLPVRTYARGNQRLGRELFDARRKETTLPVQIHSWDYLTSEYCLHPTLIFACSPPSPLFPLP